MVGLEATGGYQEAVALALHDAGHHVSVLDPSAVAAYGQSQLRRTKTDHADAALIADYVRTHQPPRWMPPPPEARQLQALIRRLDALLEMQTQETNRLELAAPILRPSIGATLAHVREEIGAIKRQIADHIDQFPTLRNQRDLIVSIPGIGDTTAAIVLGELLDIAASPARGTWPRLPAWSRRSGSRGRLCAAAGRSPSSARADSAKPCTGPRSGHAAQPAAPPLRGPLTRRRQTEDGHRRRRHAQAGSTRSTACSAPAAPLTPRALDSRHGVYFAL